MTGIDKFMWSVPETLVAACAYFFIIDAETSAIATVGWMTTLTVFFFVIYPMQARQRTQARWRH